MEVKEAVQLSRKMRLAKFDMFKKRGILAVNRSKLSEKEPEFLRERKPTNKNIVVMCDKCNGFFAKTYFSRHVNICKRTFSAPVLPITMPLLINSALIGDLSPEFKKNILGTIRDDKVGTIVKTDRMILIVGARLYDKTRRKLDKITEVQRHVCSECAAWDICISYSKSRKFVKPNITILWIC